MLIIAACVGVVPYQVSGRQRAPPRAVPHSDDSERAKYFYNPGVVSGIQHSGKKM